MRNPLIAHPTWIREGINTKPIDPARINFNMTIRAEVSKPRCFAAVHPSIPQAEHATLFVPGQ